LEETDITPADVAENLMPKVANEDVERHLWRGWSKHLVVRTSKEAEMKAKKEAEMKAEKEKGISEEDSPEEEA
jgi:hypothetical protein